MLSQHGRTFTERDFFKDPLSEDELRGLTKLAPLSEIFSWRSPSFRKMDIDAESLTPDDLLRLMAEEPRLIRRPMTRIGDRLVVGGGKALTEALTND